MAEELRGRALMEKRYGKIGCGKQQVTIRGVVYPIYDLLVAMGLNFDDARAIDVQELAGGNYCLRYYDAMDQRMVAHEFDAELGFICECRAHVAEWIGEEAYFSLFSGH